MEQIAEKYSPELLVTADDFKTCGWESAFDPVAGETYLAMGLAFSEMAQTATFDGKDAHGKVLWLLADACSMMLNPASPNQPFQPQYFSRDSRSSIPDDFTASDLVFFEIILNEIVDAKLRARLADLCWLLAKPRRHELALFAIDSYRSIRLSNAMWICDGQKLWERALYLACRLGDAAGMRLVEMEQELFAAFNSDSSDDAFFVLQISELMATYQLCDESCLVIAQRLEAIGIGLDKASHFDGTRAYFEAAALWFKRANETVRSQEMRVGVAESWAKQAASMTQRGSSSYLVAVTFYENAIQSYRLIPRKFRSIHRVDQRLEELQKSRSEAGAQAVGEMGVVRTPGVDIKRIVMEARENVAGKQVLEALKNFANLYPGVDVATMGKAALESIQKYPLQAMFASTVMAPDGRVVARRPAIGFGPTAEEEQKVAIRVGMQDNYGMLVGLVVQGQILPALDVMHLEHRIAQADFAIIARDASIVPKDRSGLFGRALFAGYDGDFTTAIHILVPQIEHMVRTHLKAAGAKTSNVDKNGIENENGLSTLMELPEANQVFGENLAFEIRALFCGPFGPNLRNVLSHGLLDEDACRSAYSVYAWWLALRLVFNTFWNGRYVTPA